jgi:hypothetical protein
MTQFNPIIGSGKTGLDYRSDDNDGKKALLNHHKGSSAPSYAEAGVLWIDDSATPWKLKVYDGADWITLYAINATTNAVSPYLGTALLPFLNFAADTGSVNAYAVAPSPAISGYAGGQIVLLKPGNANTGASTLAVSGLSPAAIKMKDGSALPAGALLSTGVYALAHNGTEFTLLNPSRALPAEFPSGAVVDSVHAAYTTNASLSTTIPFDDTVPQNTEGTQILSVTITPKSASNILRLRFRGTGAAAITNTPVICALFRDSTASALCADYALTIIGTVQAGNMTLTHEVAAGSTSATTFKIRVGASLGAMAMNGVSGGRKFGGVMAATLTVEEVRA